MTITCNTWAPSGVLHHTDSCAPTTLPTNCICHIKPDSWRAVTMLHHLCYERRNWSQKSVSIWLQLIIIINCDAIIFPVISCLVRLRLCEIPLSVISYRVHQICVSSIHAFWSLCYFSIRPSISISRFAKGPLCTHVYTEITLWKLTGLLGHTPPTDLQPRCWPPEKAMLEVTDKVINLRCSYVNDIYI